jgi:hypothetical protein
MRKLIISLLSLAAFLPAMAQEMLGDVEPEEPEIRRYTVEIIVFRYAQDVMTGSESFPPDEPEPEVLPIDEEVVIIDKLPEEIGEEPEPEPYPDAELVMLDEADFQLVEIMDRMERLDVYEPVMHFGWTQATWPEEQTEAIPLQRLVEVPEGFDGELTLYLSRYLHLVVNLQMEAPEVMVADHDNVERLGDVFTINDMFGRTDEPDEPLPVYYRLEENRILKNGELRYYDHPKFGVLAKVTRVEVEDEDEDIGEGELLGYGSE